MSEKLRQCRRELAAALDRAFKNVKASSFSNSPDNSYKRELNWQNSPSPSPPNISTLMYKRYHPLRPSYPTLPYVKLCRPKREPLAVLSNLPPADINNNSLYTKKRPLTNKENLVRNSSFSALDNHSKRTYRERGVYFKEKLRYHSGSQPVTWDLSFFDRCQEKVLEWYSDIGKYTPRLSSLETNESPVSPTDEFTQDLLDIIENTNIQTLEDLTGKLEFENELNRVCDAPEGSPFQEDILALFLDDQLNNLPKAETKAERQRSYEDESIIETVLDLEEDYNLLGYDKVLPRH